MPLAPTNRIDRRFAALRDANEAALVAFVTAGDPWPDSASTARLVALLASAGADIVELGIPYSDPQADGPSIQAASQRALEGGVNTRFVLDVVRQARQATDVPIVLMTYYNPLLRYGLTKFAADATEAGADGVILTDLPPEEAARWLDAAETCDMATIFLLAPTSTRARIELVASKMSRGFVYCVSRTGVTGARRDVPVELSDLVGQIRDATPLPVCIGFGIGTPEHVATVSTIADGAVIGSALVDKLYQARSEPNVLDTVAATVSAWKQATRRKSP